MKLLGVISAILVTDFFFHIIDSFAASLKADTQSERILAVLFGICVQIVLMAIFHRFFSKAFFHGFTVAVGLFLSFDIVVFHWIFQLHRITTGPEANWLEPIFVIAGIIFVWWGIKKESSEKKSPKDNSIRF